MVIEIVNHQ